MAEPDGFRDYPETLKLSTLHPQIVYHRSNDLIAVRGSRERSTHEGLVVTVTGDSGEPIAVYRGGPAERQAWSADSAAIAPVYTLPPAKIAVPTGRVFIRFGDGVPASAKRDALKRAGYKIAEALSYAPNAAWLEADDGRLVSALANIGRLEAVSDVVNVEPQLLAPRVAR